MRPQTKQTVIGRAELIELVDFGCKNIPAKVDTGADRNTIWASAIREDSVHGTLSFALFGPSSVHYTGQKITIPKSNYSQTMVANSFGQQESRYVVHFRIRLAGRLIRTSFSLSNRQAKTYPVLLGRRLLRSKFMVDVSIGTPLIAKEKTQHLKLQQELKKLTKRKSIL